MEMINANVVASWPLNEGKSCIDKDYGRINPKSGIGYCQNSIGAVKYSLATSYNVAKFLWTSSGLLNELEIIFCFAVKLSFEVGHI